MAITTLPDNASVEQIINCKRGVLESALLRARKDVPTLLKHPTVAQRTEDAFVKAFAERFNEVIPLASVLTVGNA